MKISFDFDGCLDHEEVQRVVSDLQTLGYDVCILTTRYSDPTNYSFSITNDDLYTVAKQYNINEIHFTEFRWKYEIIDSLDIDIHVDDNYEEEVKVINSKCKTKAITFSPYNPNWDQKLYKAIIEFKSDKDKVIPNLRLPFLD